MEKNNVLCYFIYFYLVVCQICKKHNFLIFFVTFDWLTYFKNKKRTSTSADESSLFV